MKDSNQLNEENNQDLQDLKPTINVNERDLRETLEEAENFYPLLESTLEDEMINDNSLSQFMEKFKQLHEAKMKSMNLEQINGYCKEMIEFLSKKE